MNGGYYFMEKLPLATSKVASNNAMLIKITQASQMMSRKIVSVTAIGVIFGHF